MSLGLEGEVAAVHGFPRVSGDEPIQRYAYVPHLEFSPRERG